MKACQACGEQLGPEKPPSALHVTEMRLEGEEPVESVATQGAYGLDDLAVPGSGDDDRAVGEQGVLDLDVLHVGSQGGVALGEGPDARPGRSWPDPRRA